MFGQVEFSELILKRSLRRKILSLISPALAFWCAIFIQAPSASVGQVVSIAPAEIAPQTAIADPSKKLASIKVSVVTDAQQIDKAAPYAAASPKREPQRQIPRTEKIMSDVSIAIESPKAVMKIPEKPLSTPNPKISTEQTTLKNTSSAVAKPVTRIVQTAVVVANSPVVDPPTKATPVSPTANELAPPLDTLSAPISPIAKPLNDEAKSPNLKDGATALLGERLAAGNSLTDVPKSAIEESIQAILPKPASIPPVQIGEIQADEPRILLPVRPELPNPKNDINLPYWATEGVLAIKAPVERSEVVDLETLVWAALAHSPHVQSIRLTPLIRETEIRQAQGVFDPTQFVDSIWNDRSDPVGNTLTTGGPLRLNDKIMANKAGIRGKNQSGGNFEASQELNLHNSNSLFFIPRQQADTKMLMRYTQPLMRGAGRAYNRASITIAELNTAVAGKDSNQALQMHVMDLSEAYWQLFFHRAQLLQLRRGAERLKLIASQLENRKDLDLLENQLFRAKAAVNTFASRMARTNAEIIDAEQRIRRLVNAPWIQNEVCDEIVPGSQPMVGVVVMTPEEELGAAFINRPDVLAVRDEIQAAKVKLNVAENELRPTLNIVTDAYVRGLNGQYDIGNSFGDQFSNGRPAYSGGLEYQRPRNLYLAKAIKRQRSLELQQLLFQLEDRLLDVSREVRSAVAEVNASFAELEASVGSTLATKSEVDYLEARWSSSEFLESSQISLNLEQLLDAQQRLVNTESAWALAQSQYMIALSRLRFATGTLLTLGQFEEEIAPAIQQSESPQTP